MNSQRNKWVIIFSVLILFGFTSKTTNLKSFCNYFESEQLDSCQSVLNDYFKLKSLQKKIHDNKFPEIDSLIIELSKLPCVDSCFYRADRGVVMKTNPPMADISVYKINSPDTLKYFIRIRFDEPMKVVWISKLD